MPAQKYVDKYSLKTLNMEPNMPANNSQQYLMTDTEITGSVPNLNPIRPVNRETSAYQWVTVVILCYVNLINYMDRYTIAGILDDVQTEFHANHSEGGLLQTAFVVFYMIFAPIFGYLGDRYNRRYLLAFGVFFWSVTTLIGSFMPNYWSFLIFRGMVGVGEASYSTIAPTIISDLFTDEKRSKMLAIFYFAIPVGSGMGYIVGSYAGKLFDDWRYGLRVTPILGGIAVIAVLMFLVDPPRGEAEGREGMEPSSYYNDLCELMKNKSFMLSTAGFTCVSFVTGALAWWGPSFIARGQQIVKHLDKPDQAQASFMFGLVFMLAGIVGVPLGAMMATKLRDRFPTADPVICSIGLFIAAPFFFAAILLADNVVFVVYVLIFFGAVAVNLNWSIVADILLYVVIPTRRATAEAFQILFSHALGDAGSPYLIGLISDLLKKTMDRGGSGSADSEKNKIDYTTLEYALYSTCFIEVIGAIFFLITAFYVEADKRAASGDPDDTRASHMYADQPNLYVDDPQLNCSEANLAVS